MNTGLNVGIIICLIVMIIGSLNWLTTGIRNLTEDTETDNDLLSLIGIPPEVNNYIYIVVGAASIIFVFLFLGKQLPNLMKPKVSLSASAFGF